MRSVQYPMKIGRRGVVFILAIRMKAAFCFNFIDS